MRIDVAVEEGTTVVKPHGQIDAGSARAVEDALLRLAEGDAAAVSLDLSAVPAVSSAGLSAWSGVLPRILKRSSLTIVGARPRVRRLLELSGLLRLVELQDGLVASGDPDPGVPE